MDKINFEILNLIFIFIAGIFTGLKYLDTKINTKADKREVEQTIKLIFKILEDLEKLINSKFK